MTRARTLALALLLGACAGEKPDAETARSEKGAEVVRRPDELPPVASSPGGLLGEAGLKQLQAALRRRGFTLQVTGRLDETTQRALYDFQRREGLAATSLPNLITLERLGLDAKGFYRDLGEEAGRGKEPSGSPPAEPDPG